MKKILIAFALAAFVLTGCYQMKKNAIFQVTGKITDSYGRTRVVAPEDHVQLCIRVNYSTSEGGSGSSEQCADIVTDPNGGYSMSQMLKLSQSASSSGQTITVKSAKVFGRQARKTSSSTTEYAYFPVNVANMDVNAGGGKIVANFSVMDF